MICRGKAWHFGNDIDTDAIIPARYLNTTDPEELAKHCMENIDKNFVRKISKGDIIVAGKNFGCGSSREHAPISIKAAGITCVIAKSFARIFFRNAFNMGLPIVESEEASDAIREGDEVEIDLGKGEIRDLTRGLFFKAKPVPPFMQSLVEAGGLMEWVEKRMEEKKSYEKRG